MEGGDGCFDVSERRAQREEDKAEGDRVIESSTSSDDPPPLYLPPGYRFHPEDDELIRFYLLPKVRNMPLEYNHIKEVNLYDYNPEDLTGRICNFCFIIVVDSIAGCCGNATVVLRLSISGFSL